MTTYPAGLSKAFYLDRITKEGIEVGNYVNGDISVGTMPSFAVVSRSGHIPASTFNYISWTAGTHTGPNIALSTSQIPNCTLLCTVGIQFLDSPGVTWQPNQGITVQIERSTNGGSTWGLTQSQVFYYPTPVAVGAGLSSGYLGCMFLFALTAALQPVAIRLGTSAIGYTPSSSAKQINANMRILVFNQV